MNQEDLIKGIDKLNETFKMNDDNLVLNDYERQRLFKLAYDMQMKINNLQNRIDKAIEYCEESSLTIKSHYFSDVLNILKGEDTDERV